MVGDKIWLVSEVNQGTKFYLKLPYDKFTNRKEMESNTTDMHKPKSYDWTGKTILVVEDNEPNFILIKEILKRTGVEIIHAITGIEAIEQSKNNIDLVLMDIRLPEMDGYETTRKIKSLKPDLPVIAQTAYAMADDINKCYEAGCSDYFAKPINRKELLAMINNFFHLK